RVQRFSTSGVHSGTYADVTGLKANGGIPSAPYDIASDPTDPADGGASYWAADQGSSNFAQFSYTGQWMQTIGVQQASVSGNPAYPGHLGHSYPYGCGGGATHIPPPITGDTALHKPPISIS